MTISKGHKYRAAKAKLSNSSRRLQATMVAHTNNPMFMTIDAIPWPMAALFQLIGGFSTHRDKTAHVAPLTPA